MTLSTDAAINQQLSLPEELILMLLNEESGYFRQIPGWDLNGAVAGAALAELVAAILASTLIWNRCFFSTKQQPATVRIRSHP